MASRQVAIYFAWSRSDEDHAQLGTLENRFTTLFEARRLQWPRLEHLADPTRFDQGITGFLDHLLLANFGMFADLAGTLTGNHARRAGPPPGAPRRGTSAGAQRRRQLPGGHR